MSAPHVYARDPRSAAGNCLCGGALRAVRHLLAAPGVPIPDQSPPEVLGRVYLALVCLHMHSAVLGLSFADADEVITAWSNAATDTDEPLNYSRARVALARRARGEHWRPEQPAGQPALPERAEPACPSTLATRSSLRSHS